MTCCQCQGAESLFSGWYVSRELKGYRRKGPRRTTRMLIQALESEDIKGATLLDIGGKGGAASIYDDETDDPDWEYRRLLLHSEGYAERSLPENLERLGEIHEKIAQDTHRSKERDDIRGRKIISDYTDANTQAPDDGFVKETWEKSKAARAGLKDLISRLGGS